jgi:hypothetical protein
MERNELDTFDLFHNFIEGKKEGMFYVLHIML